MSEAEGTGTVAREHIKGLFLIMDEVRHALFLTGVDQTRVTGQMSVKDWEAVDVGSLLALLLSFKPCVLHTQ